ncbi:MAG TPA: recombinase family protein, partial [Thermomicrobiales bacterium]|nr:recombinase family protein [Thermomicrobiales bacterium]
MNPFLFDLIAVMAQNERRTLLRRSADGIARAIGEGRYVGGIVPFGYRVVGEKAKARLEPHTAHLRSDQSAADIVIQMYRWVGLEGWSCRRVAGTLNLHSVPTRYVRDGRSVKRGERRERTQGIWRDGRVSNLLVSPIYRGESTFGKRSEKRDRSVLRGSVEPLVSQELWQAAQETLARNRVCAKNTRRTDLRRGNLHCAECGLSYVGS